MERQRTQNGSNNPEKGNKLRHLYYLTSRTNIKTAWCWHIDIYEYVWMDIWINGTEQEPINRLICIW